MKLFKVLVLLVLPFALTGQSQYADTSYLPPAFETAYAPGEGPVVYIDEAHNNFHTKDGRYLPFSRLLELDGFKVESFTKEFSKKTLKNIEILVISNALPESSIEQWVAPTQSAFTEDEINALEAWVERGGKLFLIADHMPMAGAARQLARVFGYTFYDSFADDTTANSGPDLFTKAGGGLSNNILTVGGKGYFELDSISSYTGQAFELPEGANSILNTGKGWIIALPDTAWVFNDDTKIYPAEGWSQGAFQNYAEGKIVFFGEAAMFTAQTIELDENTKFNAGMNSENGKNNYRLLLNIVRWLNED